MRVVLSSTEGFLLKRAKDRIVVYRSSPDVPYSMLWKELKVAVNAGVIVLKLNKPDFHTVDIYLNADLLTMKHYCVANPKLLEWCMKESICRPKWVDYADTGSEKSLTPVDFWIQFAITRCLC